jgi:hypothetical protein
MWYDEIPAESSWASLWSGYILCGICRAIRNADKPCPACGAGPDSIEWTTVTDNCGKEIRVPPVFMGAEGRYEDWVFLILLQREWERPTLDKDLLRIAELSRPSSRAALVLLFWTYFETRIERLLRQSMTNLPPRVVEDLFSRHPSIGSRLDRLYRVLFGTTYWADLNALGYQAIAELIRGVQDRRNDFVHGHPEALNDSLVESLAAHLKEEHEAWIAVFNKRAALRNSA